MISNQNGKKILIHEGQFPTLISDIKSENGKIVHNRTRTVPRKVYSTERFQKTVEEKVELKLQKKNSIFSNKLLLKA
jgi:S-adenosylmethionine:tRNA-ribosyltransferase-isomerase (queuine synthetase)